MSSRLSRGIQRIIDRARDKPPRPDRLALVNGEIPEGFAHEYDLDALCLVTPRGHDFQMYVTPRYRAHYVQQSYEPFTVDLLSSVLRRGGLFVDIGASYGFFSLLARARNPTLDIIAAEPTPETCAVLRRNVSEFGKSSIAVRQLAVSDSVGRANFKVSLASDSCGFYEHPNAATLRSIEVETTTVDALLEGREPCPLMIKIDTEGHERAVLAGMAKTLERFTDIKLFVEFSPATLRAAGVQPNALLRHLDHLGFEMHLLDEQQVRARRLPLCSGGICGRALATLFRTVRSSAGALACPGQRNPRRYKC